MSGNKEHFFDIQEGIGSSGRIPFSAHVRRHRVRGENFPGVTPTIYHPITLGGENGESPDVDPDKMPESVEFDLNKGDPYNDLHGRTNIHGVTDGTHEDTG